MTESVVAAVAECEGTTEEELEPLWNEIDPDALESLFRNSSGQVTFEYCGYTVTIDAAKNVELSENGHYK